MYVLDTDIILGVEMASLSSCILGETYKLLSCDEKLKEVCDSSFNFFLIFLEITKEFSILSSRKMPTLCIIEKLVWAFIHRLYK